MNRLEVSVRVPADVASVCQRSIEMEARSEALTRSEVRLLCEGDSLKLVVDAQDLSSLRAALNTYLRWMIMCLELVE